jgi:hypothetical protein
MRRALSAKTSPRRLEELRVEARYHLERRDVYAGEVYGSRATSRFRLKGLERACVLVKARLRQADRSDRLTESIQRRRDEDQAPRLKRPDARPARRSGSTLPPGLSSVQRVNSDAASCITLTVAGSGQPVSFLSPQVSGGATTTDMRETS